MSDKAINAPLKDVITIDLASIQAIDEFKRITPNALNEEEERKLNALVDYISEAGIQKEINFSDDRLLKIWYAINIKNLPSVAAPALGEKLEDWVLLSEYMRNFTPSDERYEALVDMLQYSIVDNWGNTMANKVELNDDEENNYKLAIAVIHGTDTWARLPEWYQKEVLRATPHLTYTPAERKLKELYGILKEKAA